MLPGNIKSMLGIILATTLPEESLATSAVSAAVTVFYDVGARADNVAITVGVIDKSSREVKFSSHRGGQAVYPASVVKLFYAAYLADSLSRKKLKMTPELERAARDMIVDSNNDATGLVLDTITGTTGGPELTGKPWDDWQSKRRVVNRFFADRGYELVNACQKTWNEGPYGRDRAFYGPNFENRNRLSPDACAKLMAEIAGVKKLGVRAMEDVDADRTLWLKTLLRRSALGEGPLDSQTKEFSGEALPTGSKLYSKAGWTSNTRHDVACVTLPDGTEMVWAIMTTGTDNAKNPQIIPWVAKYLVSKK